MTVIPAHKIKAYHFGFMGQTWDGGDVAFQPETWRAVARVLRPGANLVVFGGTRTFWRLAAAIVDAGFMYVDTISWLYGQGFPKRRTLLKPAWEPIIWARLPGPAYLRLEHGERWPTNVALDENVAAQLDENFGEHPSGNEGKNGHFRNQPPREFGGIYGGGKGLWQSPGPAGALYGDTGGASRFFYCAKAGVDERSPNMAAPNRHPTVKPLSLMAWLLRLFVPPGGTVLDPFLGSGTTALAAIGNGFEWVGIEREPEYVAIAEQRIGLAL